MNELSIIFNRLGIWMLFRMVTSYTFISNYFIGREKFIITPLSILRAIFFHGCNGHFRYIFDLMVFVLATPVIHWLTGTRRRALISIVVVEILRLMGIGLPGSIFYTDTSIVFYLIGATIGKYYLSRFMGTSSQRVRILSAALLLFFASYNVCFPTVLDALFS